MINIYELEKDLTNVGNDELGSVLGGQDVGGVFPTPAVTPSVNIPVGQTGFSVDLPTSGSFQTSDILKVPQLNYDIGGGTTLSASGSNTFGVTKKIGPAEVTGAENPSTGSTGFKVNFGIRF